MKIDYCQFNELGRCMIHLEDLDLSSRAALCNVPVRSLEVLLEAVKDYRRISCADQHTQGAQDIVDRLRVAIQSAEEILL